MDLTFCGGAREVGASCYLLKIDQQNLLLDCGIRMKGSDNLPDFRLIQEQGGVDAILVSHAHLDHSGALPVISREYPEARIYMTHASKALLRVLLYDSLKIMERAEADIPIYAEQHVVEMLDRIICFSPQYTFKPIPGRALRVTFYPAGHIAGAAFVYIQGQTGTLLYTGDYSVTDQQTVIGCSVPRLRPDVIISEATYGDKLHSNRKLEEERLVAVVREVIARNGKILIPAFALGRAQEIILILRRALNKKELPGFNIYIDGMVRSVNRIYQLHPNYLQPNLARKIFKGNAIFYDDRIIEVRDHDQREEIVRSAEPLCVISSSGMLKGGPSCYYAEEFLADRKNFIAITGYQDEEAPGRDILDLLENEVENPELLINNKRLAVGCQFGKYGLSAHADKGELLGLVHRVSPRKIFLVHGNQEIVDQLAIELNKEVRAGIYVPKNGEKFSIDLRNPRKQFDFSKQLDSLQQRTGLNPDNLEDLWRHVYNKTGTDTAYSVEELIYLQEGSDQLAVTDDQVEHYRKLLNQGKYFTPNRRRLFLYHPVAEEELTADKGIMEMNQMFTVVDRLFPLGTDLYKRGARSDDKIILLHFNFPAIAREKYKVEIAKLAVETGWEVVLNQDCNQAALEEMVYQIIPPEIDLTKISYYRDQGRCEVTLSQEPEGRKKLIANFCQITGIELILTTPESEAEKKAAGDLLLSQLDPTEMMEQNQAFKYIDEEFKPLKVKIYKKSRKVAGGLPYLELYFISPEVGQRYRGLVDKLASTTGWTIKIGQTAIQSEIINLARRMMASHQIRLGKTPSLYTGQALVKVEVNGEVNPAVLAEIKAEFKEKSGYNLHFVLKS